jgi:protein-S-isoprenylcysteine O-methyltransferase Ste14
MKKLLPPLLFAICVALMFASEYLPGSQALPESTRIVGAFAMVAGLVFLIVARLQFTKAQTNIYTFEEPGQLVTTGVFRVSRNPMYLGFALLLLGVCLLLRSMPAMGVFTAFVVITDRWYIAFEERLMREKFGEVYEEYARRIRRWL